MALVPSTCLVETSLWFRGVLPYGTFLISNLTLELGLGFHRHAFSLKNESL